MPKNKKIFLILIMVLLTIFICSTTISATDNSVETSIDCVDEKIINEPIINENKIIKTNENQNLNYDDNSDNSIKSNTNKTAITSEKSSNTESTQNIKKSTEKTNTVKSSEIKSQNITTVKQNAEDLNKNLSSYESGSNPNPDEGLFTKLKELFTKTTTQSSSVQTDNSQAKRVYVSSLGLSIFDGSSSSRPTSFTKATSNIKK